MSTFSPFIDVIGAGDALVLVHGSWTDHTTWLFAALDLMEDHLVVTYDRRGHSRSTWSGTLAPRSQDEDDLIDVIESLQLGPVHLVGSSYGASIALAVAARRPDLVRSVTGHEPPLLGIARPGSPLVEVRDQVRALLDDVVADLERGAIESGARRFVEDVALGPGAWSVLPDDIRAAMVANAPVFLASVRDPDWDRVTFEPDRSVPTLLTDGTESPPWLVAVVEELASTRYDFADRRTFDGAGHVPHLTHPGDLAAAVRDFIGSATVATGR